MENVFQTAKQYTSFMTGKTWVILIVATIVIAIAVYWYVSPKKSTALAMGPYVLKGRTFNNMDTKTTISVLNPVQLQGSLGNNFTFGFFVYMDDANMEQIPFAGTEGEFRFKKLIKLSGAGNIVLDPIHQQAKINLTPLTPDISNTIESIVVDNILMARWNHIAISVEGRTVDVYVNGLLATSTLLPNLPILSPVEILLETSPDFSGQVGMIQAWPYRLTYQQVTDYYKHNTDPRGKPNIPNVKVQIGLSDIRKFMSKSLCSLGFCPADAPPKSSLQYIRYEFA